jgi:predicted transcriptional regulator
MKLMVRGTAVILLLLLMGLIMPAAQALFFNPEGGFSVGGVHISVDQQESTVSPGETAVYNITIANDSDLPVLINTTVVSLSRWKITLEPSMLLVQAKEIVHLHLRVTAPDDADNGTGELVTILYAISFPNTGESMDVPATTINTVVKDTGSSAEYLGVLIIVTTSIALAMILSTDAGKYFASLLFSPLYSRIHKDKLLKNGIRNNLFEYIREHPGQNFSEIKRNLELNNGVLAHHLKTLEREHYIKSRKDGLYRRFFLRDQAVPNIILNQTQRDILEYLLTHSGSSQTKIATHMGVSRQTINYHILGMETMGALKIARKGRRTSCYPLVRPGPNNQHSGFAE